MSDSIFTLYNTDSAQSPKDLLNAILGNISGISIVANSINYLGANAATSIFPSFNFGGTVKMNQSGILLTSGNGAPALKNTQNSYSQANNAEGDAEFDILATKAFTEAGKTYDASILEFSFTVTDPSIKSVSFDIIFGSEEYPQYIDSSYVDIAAVLVNGTNYGLFDANPKKPLSIIGNSVNSGSFFDNQNSYDNNYNASSLYSIEFNGISPLMTVQVPLDGSAVYHVRLGVADTGDYIYDSGLFVSNFTTNTSSAGGLLVKVEAEPTGSVLTAAGADTATLFVGGKGNDTMTGSTAADLYNITAGGNNTIQGTLAQLNNDTVIGFGEGDTLSFHNAFFNTEDLTITMGSAIIEVDSNGDGKPDSTITLEGNYENAKFVVTQTSQGSEITMKETKTATLDTMLAQLYISFFGRAAEHSGLEYWKNDFNQLISSGLNEQQALTEISNSFWSAAIAYSSITGYSENMSNVDFIASVYSHILGRPDAIKYDSDGINYWANDMATTGASNGQMVLKILDAAHDYNAKNPNDPIAKYVDSLLENRTDISLFFAQKSISDSLMGEAAIQMGMDIIKRIDQHQSTVNQVKEALLHDNLYSLPEIDLVGTGTSPTVDSFIL